MASSLQTLPLELFEDILSLALDVHLARHAIPCVNSTWAEVSLPLLHSKIRLTSLRQLRLFSAAESVLRCTSWGREVVLQLPGGTENAGVWALIYKALERCQHTTGSLAKQGCYRGVRTLRLCLNSHANDPDIYLIREALRLVNPDVFVWTGPDPDHHFSTAIVPGAIHQLCLAMHTWSSLKRLELSNITFSDNGGVLARVLVQLYQSPSSAFSSSSTNNIGPREIIIRQAVFMSPISVLQIALGIPSLQGLRLIDVYMHSIWGQRLRTCDVEALIMKVPDMSDALKQESLERLRGVVKCVAKTERLIGGDRDVQEG